MAVSSDQGTVPLAAAAGAAQVFVARPDAKRLKCPFRQTVRLDFHFVLFIRQERVISWVIFL